MLLHNQDITFIPYLFIYLFIYDLSHTNSVINKCSFCIESLFILLFPNSYETINLAPSY
jgi:hypothetical protein